MKIYTGKNDFYFAEDFFVQFLVHYSCSSDISLFHLFDFTPIFYIFHFLFFFSYSKPLSADILKHKVDVSVRT